MPSNVIELRPDRRLLDHDFEGYKLNLQALPHFVHNLEVTVDRVFPDDIQYSFVHAKLFGLHNHLVLDQWDYTFSYYYIDNKQQVQHITFESSNHSFQARVVYDVPAHVERKSGHFNLSLAFPSNNLALVSDGTGYLHVVETGNRTRPSGGNTTWQTLLSTLVLGELKYFVIVDCRIQEKHSKELLHCLLLSVEQEESHFNSILSWITFEEQEQTWKQISFKELKGKGIIHYAAIESSCLAVYVASDNPFKYTSDSNNPITDQEAQQETKKINYTWLQTTEDINITLKLEEKFNRDLFHVNITPFTIKISYAGNSYIDGKLQHKVDSELTTWNIQADGQVDVLLTKSDSSLWTNMLEGGDPNGEQIMDASLGEEAHTRLSHLCSETEVTGDHPVSGLSTQQLEECDAASEEDTVLVRLEANCHGITHRIPLSVHHYLFSIKLETQEVPALALRHDVDACIWQPFAQLVNSETWPIKHQGTLLAFGYVQSSKQNRKFVTCPPNLSYSVVCEATRHIFVYQSTNNPDSQLRKCSGAQMKTVKVGQQHVFNVDQYGEVLGINATNDYLFILTQIAIIAIEVR